MKNYRLLCVFLLFLIVFTMFSYSPAAKTIYVDDDGSQPYLRIKNAIHFANDGDRIYVYSGIYEEDINVNKSIEIVGENKFSTIIEGKLTLSAPNVKISNITIRNGEYVDGYCIYNGEGLRIISDNNAIHNCIIENCLNGIVFEAKPSLGASSNYITNCIIRNNYIAIYIKCHMDYVTGTMFLPAYNHIYCNNFINNSQNVGCWSCYKDEIPLQYWNNETMGNYWSDYTGPDADRDGIGDIPYTIDKNNVDYYPLWNPLSLGTKERSNPMLSNLGLLFLICFIASLVIALLILKRGKYRKYDRYTEGRKTLFFMGLVLPFFTGLGTIYLIVYLNFPGISLSDFTTIFGDKLIPPLFVALLLFPAEQLISWVAWVVSGLTGGLLSKSIFLPFISTYSIAWLMLYFSWGESGSIFLLFKGIILLNAIIAFLAFAFGVWLGIILSEVR